MSDQKKQSIFSGELSHYTVTLAMKEKKLEIKVTDNESLYKFYGCINQKYIDSQDRFFFANFECPEDVFNYLTAHFQETVIENGILRFIYTSGKRIESRDAVVELVKERVDESALAHLRIAKLKDYTVAQRKQRDGQITALSKDFTELVNQFREYKRESQEKMGMMEEEIQKEQTYSKFLEEKIKMQQDKLQKQDSHCKMLEDRLELQEKNSKQMEERLQGEEKSGKDKEERLKKAEDIVNSIPKPISHHPQNNHQQYYTLTCCTATSATLTRVGGDGNWYNFVNKTEVLPKQHNKYAVKLLKTNGNSNLVMIGFCTEKGLGNINNCSHAESAYYCCQGNGYLYQGGTQKDLSGCGSVDGELVECVLDLLEWRVRWSKGGKVLAECAVPAAMKAKPIFFSVLLYCEADAVEANSM